MTDGPHKLAVFIYRSDDFDRTGSQAAQHALMGTMEILNGNEKSGSPVLVQFKAGGVINRDIKKTGY